MHQPRTAPRTRLLLAGLAAALACGSITAAAGFAPPAYKTAGITALCAFWWATEALPLPATAILPFALLPLAGVMDHKEVASALGHSTVLLLLSGFVLSGLIELSGVHRRLALVMLRIFGGSSYRRLLLGFMLATAALSMWIANTAVALLMLPIALAVCEGEAHEKLAAPLLLGICYAANIGGIGTPIGTPSNPIFLASYEEATGRSIGFVEWMSFGVPVVLALVLLSWTIVARKLSRGLPITVAPPGPWTQREALVALLFGLTALAWVTREDPAGGWSGLLGLVDAEGRALPGDSTVGIFFLSAAFFVPDGKGGRLLEWRTVEAIPWGLLVLVGGGVALSRALTVSGLAASLSSGLSGLASWPLLGMVLAICLLVSLATEIMSNTAISALMMPVLAAAAVGVGVDPLVLMIPGVLCCSCAFMLPVATGPNAIVYGTGRVPLGRMVRDGFVLNAAAVLFIAAFSLAVLPHILHR